MAKECILFSNREGKLIIKYIQEKPFNTFNFPAKDQIYTLQKVLTKAESDLSGEMNTQKDSMY